MKLERHVGPHLIRLESRWIGHDLAVDICGGDTPHVGSVSVASISPSPFRSTKTVSVSSLSLPGHKDYIISTPIAERLSREIGSSVVVTVGIHIDDATSQDIEAIKMTVDQLVDEFIHRIDKEQH